MDTQLVKVTDDNREDVIQQAASLLNDGQLVAIPTETVYGLAGNAFRDETAEQIFAVKGRPSDNPFIVHISDLLMLGTVVQCIPPEAAELAKRFWPGPLTMILKKAEAISSVVTCGLDTVAVRMPSHPVAQAVIEAAGIPLAAPSANLSGRPSPTTAEHVRDDLSGRIPLILDGGPCPVGIESTVISLVGETPEILRPGMISLEAIQEVLPNAIVSHAVTEALQDDDEVLSPGLKYKHYSPKASVLLVQGSFENFCDYVRRHAQNDAYAMCFDGEEELVGIPSVSYGPQNDPAVQAKRLFSALRALDRFGAAVIYVRCPEKDGESLGVYNRLIRAAGFRVVTL